MDNDVWAILKALDLSAKELLCADWLSISCCSTLIGRETLNLNNSLKNIEIRKVTFKPFIWIYFLRVSMNKSFKIDQKLEMRGVRGYTRLLCRGCVTQLQDLFSLVSCWLPFPNRIQNGECSIFNLSRQNPWISYKSYFQSTQIDQRSIPTIPKCWVQP